jgi:hypothetical protein
MVQLTAISCISTGSSELLICTVLTTEPRPPRGPWAAKSLTKERGQVFDLEIAACLLEYLKVAGLLRDLPPQLRYIVLLRHCVPCAEHMPIAARTTVFSCSFTAILLISCDVKPEGGNQLLNVERIV